MIKEYIDKDNKKYYEIKNHYIGKDIFTGKEKRISKKGFRTKKEAENLYRTSALYAAALLISGINSITYEKASNIFSLYISRCI